MPLKPDPRAKPAVQQHVNASGPLPHPQRSMTPQPSTARGRSMQHPDEPRRKSQGAVQSKEHNVPPSRAEAAALKMEVPETRPKSKLVQVTNAQASPRPGGAQQNTHAGSTDAQEGYHNVCGPSLCHAHSRAHLCLGVRRYPKHHF